MFYRLAIDLQTDSVTRFGLFEPDVAATIADITPLGVAGAHIAFLSCESESGSGSAGDGNKKSADKESTAVAQWALQELLNSQSNAKNNAEDAAKKAEDANGAKAKPTDDGGGENPKPDDKPA